MDNPCINVVLSKLSVVQPSQFIDPIPSTFIVYDPESILFIEFVNLVQLVQLVLGISVGLG